MHFLCIESLWRAFRGNAGKTEKGSQEWSYEPRDVASKGARKSSGCTLKVTLKETSRRTLEGLQRDNKGTDFKEEEVIGHM